MQKVGIRHNNIHMLYMYIYLFYYYFICCILSILIPKYVININLAHENWE